MSWITDLINKLKVTTPDMPYPVMTPQATDQVVQAIEKQQQIDDLPVVQIDEKGLVYMPDNLKLFSGGWLPGEMSSQNTSNLGQTYHGTGVTYDGITYGSTLEYAKKKFASPGDPLGINAYQASKGKPPAVKYRKIHSIDISWLPQNGGTIIYDPASGGKKIKKVVYADGSIFHVSEISAEPGLL